MSGALNRHAAATFALQDALTRWEPDMTEDHAAKLEEVERLLNDPEVVMQPGRVWSLLDEIAAQETSPVITQI